MMFARIHVVELFYLLKRVSHVGYEIRSEAMRMESWRLNKEISFAKRKHEFPASTSRFVMNVNEFQTASFSNEKLFFFPKALKNELVLNILGCLIYCTQWHTDNVDTIRTQIPHDLTSVKHKKCFTLRQSDKHQSKYISTAFLSLVASKQL